MTDYTSQYDVYLNEKGSLLNQRVSDMSLGELLANIKAVGTSADSITSGVFGATSATGGIEFGSNGTISYIQSVNFVSGTTGFRIASDGTIEGASLTLTGGTIKYGKTSFTDAVNAGYHVSSSGFYFGAAADANYVKYNISTGAFDIKAAITANTGSVLSTSYLSGLVAQGNLNVANRGWVQTSAFSVTDADTIAWGTGTFTTSDGTSYSISAGNTGNMSAKTYIYLDTAVSTTAYQITTTATTAVGAGKVLVAIAENGTNEATFMVMQGQGGQNIDAANIVAGSITANEIAASTITAGKMSITTLSSIVADIGTITAGNITLDTSGYVKGGQTDYNTGTGFFLGYSGGAYKFSIGNPSGNYMAWDGSSSLVWNGTYNHTAGNILYNSLDTARSETGTTYIKHKSIKLYSPGQYRIKFTILTSDGLTGYGRIYKSGVAVGTERSVGATPTEFSEDISGFISGDTCEIWLKREIDGAPSNVVQLTNFRIYVSQYDYSASDYDA